MVISSTGTVTSRLIPALEDALQALARLRASAERMRPGSRGSAPGLETLSTAGLDQLSAVIRESTAAIARRLKQIDQTDENAAPRVVELWRAGVPPHSRSLVATYRATCRALCTALEDARQTGDRTTAALLSAVLHRLEKQLWLLDSSRERPRVGLPLINLFLSC